MSGCLRSTSWSRPSTASASSNGCLPRWKRRRTAIFVSCRRPERRRSARPDPAGAPSLRGRPAARRTGPLARPERGGRQRRGRSRRFSRRRLCVSPGLLEEVAKRFASEPSLDGLTGRAVDEAGRSSPSWANDPQGLTRENLWNRAISFTIFLRAPLVARIGRFDEELGLGASTPWLRRGDRLPRCAGSTPVRESSTTRPLS